MPPSSDELGSKEVEAYLDHLGIPRTSVGEPTLSTLARLQRAHVTTVPFETLSITGDPYGEREGEGVVLSLPHLYDKIVERGRGGYCFELKRPVLRATVDARVRGRPRRRPRGL